MNKRRDSQFNIEIIIMLICVIFTVTATVRFFSYVESESRKARHLSDSVILASNCSEIFFNVEDIEELYEHYKLSGKHEGETVTLNFNDDLVYDEKGNYHLELKIEKEKDFLNLSINVLYRDEEIYHLDTGRYYPEGSR